MNVSPYTFGTMSLGRDENTIASDVRCARQAMDAGVWFHSSPTYNRGFTYMVLRMAFDQDRARVPRLILKLRDASPELLRFEAEDACRRLGIGAIDVAQLVSFDRGPGNLASQLMRGGPIADELASLRARGLIRSAVIYVDRGNSDAGFAALSSPLVEGLTFYWNATQRDCSNRVWQELRKGYLPVLALRTLGGAAENPLLAASGCADAVEFGLRLAASYKAVRCTIGGTSNPDHLRRYLECAHKPRPLPLDVLEAWERAHQGPEHAPSA
jgi:aryl-alcohol dehydrogenase-like predicted oxidoreductase